FRQALLDANSGACASPCEIVFTAGGVLLPLSPLPVITASNVTISGVTPQQFFRPETIIDGRNAGYRSALKFAGTSDIALFDLAVINSEAHGVFFDGVTNGKLRDCWTGIDPRNDAPSPNAFNGIAIRGSKNITVANIISGSNTGSGVYVADSDDIT